MKPQPKASKNFRFYTSSLLVEITGKKAYHLKDFIKILKEIDASSIFFHVHHTFREYTFASGEYTNDFARWVGEDLEENSLAERLASINIKEYADLEALRQKLIEIIENHLMNATEIRKAAPGREFYFLRHISIVTPTPYEVSTIAEFVKALKRVGMRSLYFHFFDARLRLGHPTNDFSNWLRLSLGEKEKADKIDQLDPYFMSMDELRDKIIAICQGEEESKLSSSPLRTLFQKAKKLLRICSRSRHQS